MDEEGDTVFDVEGFAFDKVIVRCAAAFAGIANVGTESIRDIGMVLFEMGNGLFELFNGFCFPVSFFGVLNGFQFQKNHLVEGLNDQQPLTFFGGFPIGAIQRNAVVHGVEINGLGRLIDNF